MMIRCFLPLFLLVCGHLVSSAEIEYAKPWDVGVNICAYLSRPGILDYKICTYCLPWRQEYGKQLMQFKYDCCPGFLRSKRFDDKCVEREKTWKLIPGLLVDHGLNYFTDLFLHKKLGAGFADLNDTYMMTTYTVIAPYSSKVTKKGELDYDQYKGQKFDSKASHPIMFHVLKGRLYLRDMRNGMVLTTLYRKQKLKVTKYSNGIICIECRELVEPDHEARNGIIHYFAGMMTPHYVPRDIKRRSLTELLDNDPNTSSFAKSLSKKLRRQLSNPQSCNWYTVFAPNNDVWDEVKRLYPEKAEMIAANHVLRRGLYCSAAMISLIQKLGPTFADQYLTVDCDPNGKRMVRAGCGPWANVVKADIMANNGVTHVIDKALMPLSGLSLEKALETGCIKGNNDWIKYLKECDLRMKPGKKYAVLIPTNDAFSWWKDYKRFQKYYERFQTDAEFRCRLIRFHIFEIMGNKATSLEYLWLQQEGYRTNNVDRLWEVDYFMKMYFGSLLYFHYSPVNMFRSYQFRDGNLYFINRVNMIPEKNLLEILPSRDDFSITNKLTKIGKMGKVFKKVRPLNLYLVVRNGGYTNKLQTTLSSVESNARNFLLLHYVPLYLWGGDIGYFEFGTRHIFRSGLNNIELIFDRERNGTMFIGHKDMDRSKWAIVVEWNIFAIDGMIWVLDRPLDCPGDWCKKLLEVEVWKVLSFACWESLRVRRGARASQMGKWLDDVEGDQCFTNRQTPKSETSEHTGGRRR